MCIREKGAEQELQSQETPVKDQKVKQVIPLIITPLKRCETIIEEKEMQILKDTRYKGEKSDGESLLCSKTKINLF